MFTLSVKNPSKAVSFEKFAMDAISALEYFFKSVQRNKMSYAISAIILQ
jgi:hypothetical protein